MGAEFYLIYILCMSHNPVTVRVMTLNISMSQYCAMTITWIESLAGYQLSSLRFSVVFLSSVQANAVTTTLPDNTIEPVQWKE
jgi:hypothetical protein